LSRIRENEEVIFNDVFFLPIATKAPKVYLNPQKDQIKKTRRKTRGADPSIFYLPDKRHPEWRLL
jgi:hypothetical protein